jgi:hypothetical protein
VYYNTLTGCANDLCPLRLCCKQVFQKPLIVINYPKGIKAFYMKVNDPLAAANSDHSILRARPRHVACCQLCKSHWRFNAAALRVLPVR